MEIVNYMSNAAVPIIILLIIIYGLVEKSKVFDTFLKGAKDGIKIVVRIFPTLVGLFVAISVLRSSGILEVIINIIKPIINLLQIPSEVMPLAMLRPISGSASLAVATDIMEEYGVDTKIGLIASTIMGSTETTLYTIAIYAGSIGIKNTRFVLWAALAADVVRNVIVCFYLENYRILKDISIQIGDLCKIRRII